MSQLDLGEAKETIEQIFAQSDAQPAPDGALPGRPIIPLIKALIDAYGQGYLAGRAESMGPDHAGKLQYAEGRCSALNEMVRLLLERLDRR